VSVADYFWSALRPSFCTIPPVFLLEGDSFLFRAALALLAVLEPRLFFPERKELLELLR